VRQRHAYFRRRKLGLEPNDMRKLRQFRRGPLRRNRRHSVQRPARTRSCRGRESRPHLQTDSTLPRADREQFPEKRIRENAPYCANLRNSSALVAITFSPNLRAVSGSIYFNSWSRWASDSPLSRKLRTFSNSAGGRVLICSMSSAALTQQPYSGWRLCAMPRPAGWKSGCHRAKAPLSSAPYAESDRAQ